MRFFCVLALLALAAQTRAAAISSDMIVEVQDITSVSVSPDGQLAAVGVCHSNPRTNKDEQSWVIVPLHRKGELHTIPGGEEIYDPSAPGALLIRQALWSPDNKWFFYLRRDGEQVQLWETRSDGGVTRQVTHSPSDLIDLRRSSDPGKFILQLAPDRAALRSAEDEEMRDGIVYDDHVIGSLPIINTLPIIDRWRNTRLRMDPGTNKGEWVPPGWNGRRSAIFDASSRRLSIPEAAMPSAFDPSDAGPNRVKVVALEPVPQNTYDYGGKYTLELGPTAGQDRALRCDLKDCQANRIDVLGWSPDAREIYYLADSLGGDLSIGAPGGAALYAWNPHENVVRLIHDTGQEGLWARLYNLRAFLGLSFEPAPIAGHEFVAAFTGVDQPPRLVSINLDTGATRILFDPNSDLRLLTRGRAMLHTWETSIGYSGRGIMVMPDDFRAGEKYPAVITTYSCGSGLLHGGGGDGPPEFVLAHQGFIAVCLSFRVREIIARESDRGRIYSIMCGIVSGLIADLSKQGILDPSRVGLAGESLSGNAGAYCISHSNDIAAVALRHGSAVERATWDLFYTSAWIRGPDAFFKWMSLPDPRNDPEGRWDALSVASRAREINTPTLIEASDTEYLTALPLWSAMRQEGKPIEMVVFPEETHQIQQPIHKLVNYDRQIDWFKFWLKQEEDAEPSKKEQYARWKRLRALTGK